MEPGDLDHMDADAAAGRDHDHPLAGLDRRPVRHMDRCRDGIGDGGGQHRIERLRQADGIAGGKHRHLRVATVPIDSDIANQVLTERLQPGQAPAAAAAEEVEVGAHPLSDALVWNARPHPDDAPHQLVPGNAGKRGRVVTQVAADTVEDGEADATGLDLDQHLTLSRHRIGHLFQGEGPSPLVDPLRFHNGVPFRRGNPGP